jgi:hypothetical protein
MLAYKANEVPMSEQEHDREVQILVNEHPVHMRRGDATGLQIKEAAIAQGVAIQPEFVLSEELGERRSRVIGDNQKVEMREHLKFVAVAPDDNS